MIWLLQSYYPLTTFDKIYACVKIWFLKRGKRWPYLHGGTPSISAMLTTERKSISIEILKQWMRFVTWESITDCVCAHIDPPDIAFTSLNYCRPLVTGNLLPITNNFEILRLLLIQKCIKEIEFARVMWRAKRQQTHTDIREKRGKGRKERRRVRDETKGGKYWWFT